MKALVCMAPGKFEYREISDPVLEQDHVIIKISRIGICGTDLHAYEGIQPFFKYPRILGHELSGQIIAGNHVEGFELGEAVTIIPYFSCGKCIACLSGKSNCCVNIQVCGVHIDGGMTEYLSVPSYSLVHGDGLSMKELALIEPQAIGAHGIRRAHLKVNEYVLIVGAGPIGLGAAEYARIAGSNVIVMDIQEYRLSICKEKLSIQHVINPSDGDVREKLMEITHGNMPTVVIDATGNLNAINHSFDYLAHGGRYILIGLQKGFIEFSHPEFHKREATLKSSRNATREDFEHVIQSMKTGKANPVSYLTDSVKFDRVPGKFISLINHESDAVKSMIEMYDV
ncbi:MAG: zinc-binding alcohol dehydrogenase family protein [Chitinophagaceae bacterium]|nr:MAG: zinc-binding alcohol dehydrogenase family protein [Chitinophagaceae bacterium]